MSGQSSSTGACRTLPLPHHAQVIAYRLMHKFNIFDINTDLLVNMRAAERPDDPRHPLARSR